MILALDLARSPLRCARVDPGVRVKSRDGLTRARVLDAKRDDGVRSGDEAARLALLGWTQLSREINDDSLFFKTLRGGNSLPLTGGFDRPVRARYLRPRRDGHRKRQR